jgi:N-glycosylase/DNA lyase
MGESEAEISKEALEEFIINHAPIFEDIPFDFPTLLKKRKEESKTWMQIAKEAGVPSSQISSKYSLYKKRVEKLMRDGGAA